MRMPLAIFGYLTRVAAIMLTIFCSKKLQALGITIIIGIIVILFVVSRIDEPSSSLKKNANGSLPGAANFSIKLPDGLYSTVTLFARLRGWSTSLPRSTAIW